jgi:hypothetical protein
MHHHWRHTRPLLEQARAADLRGWELRESEAQQAAQLEQEIREEERKARERRALDEMAVYISFASVPSFIVGPLCMICLRPRKFIATRRC